MSSQLTCSYTQLVHLKQPTKQVRAQPTWSSPASNRSVSDACNISIVSACLYKRLVSLMPRWLSPSKQKVLKALFQGSVLLPYHAASETAASLSNAGSFRFAAAYSAKPLLSTAVVDCVNAIKTQLGPDRHPHFCQLLVTADAHGGHIEYAPSVRPSASVTFSCCWL